MNDLDQIARQLNDAAAACERSGGTQTAHMMRDISRRITELARVIDAATPIMRAALLGDGSAVARAWGDHAASLNEAMDRAIYCPYDSDRCHDTDYCHCPNCTQRRKDYP